jgi:hypothetical protein
MVQTNIICLYILAEIDCKTIQKRYLYLLFFEDRQIYLYLAHLPPTCGLLGHVFKRELAGKAG